VFDYVTSFTLNNDDVAPDITLRYIVESNLNYPVCPLKNTPIDNLTMPGERKRSSVAEKKSKDDDDVPIVVNISPSKATRGSPSVKVISNGSSSSPSCVPQRRAAASAEKSFISSPMKPGEKKEAEKKKREAENKKSKGKKESSDDDKSDDEKEKKSNKKKAEKKQSKGKKESSDDDGDESDDEKGKEGKTNGKKKEDEKKKNVKKKPKEKSDEEEGGDDDEPEDDQSDSSDSDSKSNKKKGSVKQKPPKVMIDPKTNETVESINCTACSKQTPVIRHKIKRHPTLNCSVCRRCYQFYFDGEFEKDEDGTEVHCQWCAEGGNVLMCDDCPHVFCRSCLKRNLGQDRMKEIEKADNWKCLVCNPKPVESLIRECDRVMNKFGESNQDKVNLKLDKVASSIDELEKGVQLWTKFLKNVRSDFKDLEKKKKKNSADEYRKKITKVGKDVVKIVKNMKTFVTKVEGDLTVTPKPTTNGEGSEFITIEEIVDDDEPVDTSVPKTSSASNASKADANSVSIDLSDISSSSSSDGDSDSDSDSSSESEGDRRRSKYEADPNFSTNRTESKGKGKGKKRNDDDEEEEGEE